MADIAAYQQQAASVYDPQFEAERKQAEFKKQSSLTGLGEEERGVEPEYQKALRGLGDQLREGEARLNQLYSQRLGGAFSGLQGNDLGQFFSKGAQQRSDIETQRANKLANIASRRTLAGQEYETAAGALTSRYQGLKNQYAQDLYQSALRDEENRRRADEDSRRWQQEMNLKRQQLANESARNQGPTLQQRLTQLFGGYAPAYEGGDAYHTEREVIPALMADYGLSRQDAANVAYEYRKRAYGEGYGEAGRTPGMGYGGAAAMAGRR